MVHYLSECYRQIYGFSGTEVFPWRKGGCWGGWGRPQKARTVEFHIGFKTNSEVNPKVWIGFNKNDDQQKVNKHVLLFLLNMPVPMNSDIGYTGLVFYLWGK